MSYGTWGIIIEARQIIGHLQEATRASPDPFPHVHMATNKIINDTAYLKVVKLERKIKAVGCISCNTGSTFRQMAKEDLWDTECEWNL